MLHDVSPAFDKSVSAQIDESAYRGHNNHRMCISARPFTKYGLQVCTAGLDSEPSVITQAEVVANAWELETSAERGQETVGIGSCQA